MAVVPVDGWGWFLGPPSVPHDTKNSVYRPLLHLYDLSKPYLAKPDASVGGNLSATSEAASEDPCALDRHETPESPSSKVTKTSEQAGELTKRVRRPKKRKSALNAGEEAFAAYHNGLLPFVIPAIASILQHEDTARHLHQLRAAIDLEPNDVSATELAAASPTIDFAAHIDEDHANGAPYILPPVSLTVPISTFAKANELINRIFACGPTDSVVSVDGEEYIIPARATFLMCDIGNFRRLMPRELRYDAVVVDPPWENKSVKRSDRYGTLSHAQLLSLPVDMLLSDTGVVFVWVTNRAKHIAFVKDELFRRWGVEMASEWIWVKITTTGEPVSNIDSPHRKPYETLLVARRRGPGGVTIAPRSCIVSVPSRIHSHKPSLRPIITATLGKDAQCLELFARNLTPGWTSWGNEALRLQHTSYFDQQAKR